MRRRICGAVVALGLLAGCSASEKDGVAPASDKPSVPGSSAARPGGVDQALEGEFARLEATYDARLGVYAVDTGSGRSVSFRPDERFAYASVFKMLVSAVVLNTMTPQQLDEVVRYTADDVVSHSPITAGQVSTGMTWRELCDAAVRYSDSTAGNLLLRRVGGPAGLEAALAAIGDDVTQVDRYEPGLASAVPGDPRDTTTPRALTQDLRAFAVDDTLAADDRAVLVDLLQRNTTGNHLIRAAVPAGWVVGDKTGSAEYGGRNDTAVVWPPGRAPIVITVMTSRGQPEAERSDELVADAARVAIQALG